MQRTENEFDAELVGSSRPWGHVIWLASFPGSSPTLPTERVIYFMISVKLWVLKAPYPLTLSTELVSFHWV